MSIEGKPAYTYGGISSPVLPKREEGFFQKDEKPSGLEMLAHLEASAGVGSNGLKPTPGATRDDPYGELYALRQKDRQSKRAEILDTAKGYVTKDRQATHGDLEDSFGRTAKLWAAHLGVEVSAVDVTIMMALLKVARLGASPDHADNWIDLAGYAACGGELALGAKG